MQHRRIPILITFIFLMITTARVVSQPSLQYSPVITSLSNPVDIVNAHDSSDRLFIVQKEGIIKVYNSSYQYLGDFLSMTGVSTQGERGLLSLAFHPAYQSNGLFYVYYTNAQGNLEVAGYKVSNDPHTADTLSKKIIITIPHPGPSNHNGGKLHFGPDGYLYFATGDGGGAGDVRNNAQNGNSLLGKMIRISIDNPNPPFNYSIPADNPFINDTAIADEIWALGLRNPWRWSFDRLTGDMWIGDVGQNMREEINAIKSGKHKGVNYGWRCYEGSSVYADTGCQPATHYTAPIFDYPRNPNNGGWVVTGGYVYRGSEYPSLNGYYIFADYGSANQWTIKDSAGKWVIKQQTGNFPRNISAFGEGEDGSLYACTLPSGIVYKIQAVTGVAFQLLNFTGTARNTIAELNWSANEQNLQQYEVEASTDSINFERKGIVPAKNQASNSYSFNDRLQGTQRVFYRLRIVSNDGKWDYSRTITVSNLSSGENFIYPSFITNQVISCFIPEAHEILQVFSINGALVLKRDIRGITGRIDIPISNLAKGMYFVKVSGGRNAMMQRIFIN